MEKTIEQRAAVRFCWKAGFNATKTFEMIQKVYGESISILRLGGEKCCSFINKENNYDAEIHRLLRVTDSEENEPWKLEVPNI